MPGYGTALMKEMEAGGIEGMKQQQSDTSALGNDDEDSMFDIQSEMPEEIPDKVRIKMDKLEEANINCTNDLKEKNGKILEMLADLEEIKI